MPDGLVNQRDDLLIRRAQPHVGRNVHLSTQPSAQVARHKHAAGAITAIHSAKAASHETLARDCSLFVLNTGPARNASAASFSPRHPQTANKPGGVTAADLPG